MMGIMPANPALTPTHCLHARALLWTLAVVACVACVCAVRFVRLDTLPGEWYGDISTLFELGQMARKGNFPPTLYVLGVGPLYPLLVVAPLLGIVQFSYLTFKLASVAFSIAGLACLHALTARLQADRRFALLSVFVAGTGAWLLALSRLGDLHMLAFALTTSAVWLAVSVAQSAHHGVLRAMACALLSVAGLYTYGAAFPLPWLTAFIVCTAWTQGRVPRASLLAFVATAALGATPWLYVLITHWADVSNGSGHFAKALGGPADWPGNLLHGMRAYFFGGDLNARVNPPGQSLLDPMSGVAMLAGIAWWLQRTRRRQGIVVIAAFVLMQLPSLLVVPQELPNAGRAITAAPFAYLLVAGGLWWGYGALARHMAPRSATGLLVLALAIILATNVQRYFVRYPAHLPLANTEVSRPIARFIASLPAGSHAYLVDTSWGSFSVPEFKSVRYQLPVARAIVELHSNRLGCAALTALPRPGMLIWRPQQPAPWPVASCACAGPLSVSLHLDPQGLPLFHSAPLPTEDLAGTC